MYFLYREIQWACLPGYVVMLFLIPAQARMGKLFATLRYYIHNFCSSVLAVNKRNKIQDANRDPEEPFGTHPPSPSPPPTHKASSY